MHLIVTLFFLLLPLSAAAQNVVPDTLGVQKQLGYFDLFDLSAEERRAHNLDELEDPNKPKATVDRLIERYIQNCMAQESDRALDEPKIKEFICLCSAARVGADFDPEDIRAMFAKVESARFQQERMMVLAVLPCMKKPLNHQVLNKCVNAPVVKRRTRNLEEACACTVEDSTEGVLDRNYHYLVKDNPTLEGMFSDIYSYTTSGNGYSNAARSCSYYN